MTTHARLLSCAALLCATLAGLGQFRPAWAARMDLDWWSLPQLREELRRGEEWAAAQRSADAAILSRVAAKRRVTQQLLAGQLTLTQAAARFRDLNAAPGTVPLEGHMPGATEEERLCRQVIEWVGAQAALPGRRESGRPTRDRLEAELNALLDRNHGIVALHE